MNNPVGYRKEISEVEALKRNHEEDEKLTQAEDKCF